MKNDCAWFGLYRNSARVVASIAFGPRFRSNASRGSHSTSSVSVWSSDGAVFSPGVAFKNEAFITYLVRFG